jgi:hypothetical protein
VAASELVGSRLVAVYPVLGWWERSAEHQHSKVPFSLVASLDFGEVDVDVFTPIAVEIEQEIES